MPKDKELQDHERAHTGQPGAKVRHGADATGGVGKRGRVTLSLTKHQHDILKAGMGAVADLANVSSPAEATGMDELRPHHFWKLQKIIHGDTAPRSTKEED